MGLKFSSKKSHEFASFSLIHSFLHGRTLEENSKGKDRISVELNHYLEITRSHIHQIYRELETSGKVIAVDLVRKLFYGVDEDSETLLQVFREHNEQSRKLIGKDFVSKTVQRYETTTRYLEEFIKKKYQLSDIALNNLEANFISKFDAFLKIKKISFNATSKCILLCTQLLSIQVCFSPVINS